MNKVKITIVGAGYVGMSLAVLLAKHHEIKVLDIDKEKVQMINAKKSPLADTSYTFYHYPVCNVVCPLSFS